MCAQKLTDVSLIYRTEPKTKTRKMERTISKNGYAQKKRRRKETVKSVQREEKEV